MHKFSLSYLYTLIAFSVLGIFSLSVFKKIEQALIFYPEKLPKDFTFSFPYKFEEITLIMKDKIKISALYFPSNQDNGIIFYFHGNAESLRSWGYVAGEFLPLGWNVFIFDYRGFGKSEGEPTEKLLHSDALEIYEYLKFRFNDKEILPYGRSIGTGIAAKLAQEKNTNRLILETPYTSLPELAKIYFPFIPSFLLSYKLNTFEYVKKFNGKTLVLHGGLDEIIPVDMGRKFQELGSKIHYVEISYGRHNNLSDFQLKEKSIQKFLLE